LIAAFVVAFKIMEMVFETILVSILSGAFYIGLSFILDYSFSLNNMLLFAFLGSTLYMLYSFLASAYTIFSKLIGIPYSILASLFKYIRAAAGETHEKKVKQKTKNYTERMELLADKIEAKAQRSANKKKNKDVKEVVLDKVSESNKDEKED
jgi:hypothetical protein